MQIGLKIPEKLMNYYNNTAKTDHPEYYLEPNILKVIDNFLTPNELIVYQGLLSTNWTLGPTVENFKYLSKDLYYHYQWNGDWSNVRWREDAPFEWELLYNKIAEHLPPHQIHWVDLKITTPLSTGTPLHRDKDPWIHHETGEKFSKALSIICNLNSKWDTSWGGALIAYQAQKHDDKISYVEYQRIPITPGQLIIAENFYHGIEPVSQSERHRMSFILHVLQNK